RAVLLRQRCYPLATAQSPRRKTVPRPPASLGSSLEGQDPGRGPPGPEGILRGSRSLTDLGGFADSSGGFSIRPCIQGDNLPPAAIEHAGPPQPARSVVREKASRASEGPRIQQ